MIGNSNNSLNTPQMLEIKNRAIQFINCIDAFGCDPRRKAIAMTKVEEATMFATKSLT